MNKLFTSRLSVAIWLAIAVSTIATVAISTVASASIYRRPRQAETPMSRLDSILMQVPDYGSGNPSKAFDLEAHLAEFPNSSRLKAGIAHAFLLQTHLYRSNEGLACADTLNYAFADSAIDWLRQARETSERSDLANRSNLSTSENQWENDFSDAYLARAYEALRAGDKDGVLHAVRDAKSHDAITNTSIGFARYVLDVTPKNGIFWLSRDKGFGSRLAAAIFYLQFVKEYRSDVSVVIGWNLLDDVYLHRLAIGIPDLQRPIAFNDAPMLHPAKEKLLNEDDAGDAVVVRYGPEAIAYFHSKGYAMTVDSFAAPRKPDYTSNSGRCQAILFDVAWNRPSVGFLEGKSVVDEHPINALVSEWFPYVATNRTEMDRSTHIINLTYQATLNTLDDPKFHELYSGTYDSSWTSLPFDLASQAVYLKMMAEKQLDSSAIVDMFKRLWTFPIVHKGETWTTTLSFAVLAYPTYHPAGIEKVFAEYFDAETPTEKSINPSIPSQPQLYAAIAHILGKCDVALNAQKVLSQQAKQDSVNREELHSEAKSLKQALQLYGCAAMKPEISLEVHRPTKMPIDSLFSQAFLDKRSWRGTTIDRPSYYRPNEPIELSVVAAVRGPKPTVILKIYNETTSELVQVDTVSNLQSISIPSGIRSFLPEGFAANATLFPITLPADAKLGEYRIDCLESGEVRAHTTFKLRDPKPVEYPKD